MNKNYNHIRPCLLIAAVALVSWGCQSEEKLIERPLATKSNIIALGGVDECERLVNIGMTTTQIDKMLGKPDSIRAGLSNKEPLNKGNFTWSYRVWKSKDPPVMDGLGITFRKFRVTKITRY